MQWEARESFEQATVIQDLVGGKRAEGRSHDALGVATLSMEARPCKAFRSLPTRWLGVWTRIAPKRARCMPPRFLLSATFAP